MTDVGLNVTAVGAMALMFSPLVTVVPEAEPLMVAVVSAVTDVVVTTNATDV